MPVLTDDTMQQQNVGGTRFTFSHKKIDELAADKFTLGTLVVDVTGSVSGLERQIEGAIKTVVRSCAHNPLADNMLLRVVLFSTRMQNGVEEVHGFKPVPEINEADYDGIIRCGGGTPLNDAAFTSIQATVDLGADMSAPGNDFIVNGICIVVTDGEENASSVGRDTVRQAIEDAVRGEALESFRPVLVGLNVDPGSGTSHWLELFKNEAGFDQYIAVGDATERKLAKLADWISQSISSQSQSLGSGGPSQSLTF